MKVSSSAPENIGSLAGSEHDGMPGRRISSHAGSCHVAPIRRDDASVTCLRCGNAVSGASGSSAWWNAVIWLSSRSVVIKGLPVKLFRHVTHMGLRQNRGCPRRALYARSHRTVAIISGWPPSILPGL